MSGSTLTSDVSDGMRMRKGVQQVELKTESTASGPNVDQKLGENKTNTSPVITQLNFRQRKRGVWTFYYLPSPAWSPLAMLGDWEDLSQITTNIRVWWRFCNEVFSLGPVILSVYFASLAISSILPSMKLKNDSDLLSLAEMAIAGRTEHATVVAEFRKAFMKYLITLVVVWVNDRLQEYSCSIVEQRVTLHFERQILAVHSRLELAASQDPDIDTGLQSATRHSSGAAATLSGLLGMLSTAGEVMALGSTLNSQLESSEGLSLFVTWALMYPALCGLQGVINLKDRVWYAKVTDLNWLRMQALYQIGTEDKYKQEILSSRLDGYINGQYAQSLSKLGDKSTEEPWIEERRWFDLENLRQVFDSLPLLSYSWNAVHNPSKFSLSAMVMMQQTSRVVRDSVSTMIDRLKNISNLTYNIITLYEVLDSEPGIVDGHVPYPDEKHGEQSGMAVEFKSVSFGYPSVTNKVLKGLSFKIEPGQLCVIVGENGCGKSTTINLINRLYDYDSGEIYIDGRPIRDYKVSTLREAINIMYQSYAHFPLTIKENLLMGNTESIKHDEHTAAIENAAKLGGAYDFIQQFPRKFETTIEPTIMAGSSSYCRVVDREKFSVLLDGERHTDLSGGQWQRLALSRSFMKNSPRTRLLCYDEPSASLDPKAEVEMFDRLRSLRGEKTMIFVTHRFGHLTKHADLIIYIGDGSVIEQGTHKSLLAQGGEYAKIYNIQSEAFAD